MRTIVGWICGFLIGLFAVSAAYAHHSGTMFAEDKTIEIKGVVKEFQFLNPHPWLIVDVTNSDGTVTTWGFEAAAGVTPLIMSGIKKTDLPPGMKVTVKTHPMRDGRPAGAWLEVTREDGRVISMDGVNIGRGRGPGGAAPR